MLPPEYLRSRIRCRGQTCTTYHEELMYTGHTESQHLADGSDGHLQSGMSKSPKLEPAPFKAKNKSLLEEALALMIEQLPKTTLKYC